MKVGLTGGIACGKSHVLRGLAQAGFVTLDLDAVAHALTAAGGVAVPALVEEFGATVLAADGGIDRRGLGTVVFRDAGARGRLNGIIHPLVRAEEERRARAVAGGPGVLVVDGALLVETGGHLRFDRLIVVHCPLDVQLERLARRDGLAAEAALQRVAAQLPAEEKRRFAAFALDTAHPPEETDRQVAALAETLWELASRGPSLADVSLSEAQIVRCLAGATRCTLRGWPALSILRVAVEAGRLDLGELCARFAPEQEGAWHALPPHDGSGGATVPLAAALVAVLVELTCGSHDAGHALAAAASLARLARRDPAAIAESCLLCEALLSVASLGSLPRQWRSRLSGWREEAAKWGSPTVAVPVAAALDVVALQTEEPRGTRENHPASEDVGEDGSAICAALLGLVPGAPPAAGALPEAQEAARNLAAQTRPAWNAPAPAQDPRRGGR